MTVYLSLEIEVVRYQIDPEKIPSPISQNPDAFGKLKRRFFKKWKVTSVFIIDLPFRSQENL